MPNRRLPLDISARELAARPGTGAPAGIFHHPVQDADTGPDFDFRIGCRDAEVGRDTNETKIVVVGMGKIAGDQHVPAIAPSPTFTLAAAVTRSGRPRGWRRSPTSAPCWKCGRM